MVSESFYALDPERQVERLEVLAREGLENWGLADAELCLLKYRENCVFAVREVTTDTRYALRIHRPGYHSEAALHSELVWMESLRAAGIETPEVIHTKGGSLMVSVKVNEVPEARTCDLLGWVDGEVAGNIEGNEGVAPEQMRATYYLAGQLAARIHNQAQDWTSPPGFQRPVMDGEGLVGKAGYLGDFRSHPDLTSAQRDILDRSAEKVIADLETFGRGADRFGLSHADFLPENFLVDGDSIRIIDFDDCGFGWFMMDIATALHFFRGEPYYEAAYKGLIEGYRSHRKLPDEHLALLPTCFLARALAYVGWAATRHETETAKELSPMLIEDALAQAEVYRA